jgi:hypothetical protein
MQTYIDIQNHWGAGLCFSVTHHRQIPSDSEYIDMLCEQFATEEIGQQIRYLKSFNVMNVLRWDNW